ncbi:MAG: hypothetical protein AABY22_10350 [Nanoarchaeota archaeon]
MTEEKKVYGYVENMKVEEIIHKVYLMTQSRIDDWYILLNNLMIVVEKITGDSDAFNELNKDSNFREAFDIIKANVEIMKENQKRLEEEFAGRV